MYTTCHWIKACWNGECFHTGKKQRSNAVLTEPALHGIPKTLKHSTLYPHKRYPFLQWISRLTPLHPNQSLTAASKATGVPIPLLTVAITFLTNLHTKSDWSLTHFRGILGHVKNLMLLQRSMTMLWKINTNDIGFLKKLFTSHFAMWSPVAQADLELAV